MSCILTGMNSHVGVQFGHLVEGLATYVAHVVPDASVLLHVLAQSRVTPKRFVTFGTLERLLAGVQAEVNLGRIQKHV